MNNWPRVKELFHGALEREPAERAAFLMAACANEAAVREEVERLLDAHARAGGFIEPSPVAIPGRVIGHYQLERLIGAGGMGEVYLARDLELGRAVAVKLARGAAGEHGRLKREAQHASQLNHPNICTIHQVGEVDGQPFIVMEFIEGQRLSDLIPDDGLPIDQLKKYGAQIADALAHAHRHGVVHRDLKTANIVVTPEGRVKVLDFGLARRLSAETLKDISASRQSITAEELLAGTLSCMAPELLRGGTADMRSDIWALGVLLYETATGKPPFSGATGFELTGAILHTPPDPLADSLPQALQGVITRCLEKDPTARYQNAGAIREALQVELSGTTAVAPEKHGGSMEQDPPYAHNAGRVLPLRPGAIPNRVAWIGALVLVVLGLIGYRVLRPDDAPVAVGASGRPAIAVMSFENAGGQDAQWLAQGVPSMLLTGLAQSRGLDIVSVQRLREAAKQQGVNDLASLEDTQAGEVAQKAGAGAIVTGTVYKAGTDIRIDARVEDLTTGRVLMAQSVRGADVFTLVDQLAARIRSEVGLQDDPAIRRVADVSTSSLDAFRLFSQGVDAYVHARGDDAARALEEAVRIDPGFAEAYMQLAAVAGFRGQPRVRRNYLFKAAEHSDRLSEGRTLLLKLQLAREENPEEAMKLLNELVAKFPETEQAYTIAGLLYGNELRDKDKIIEVMKTGISALPNSASVRNHYGYVLLERGQYADAIRQFEKYVELSPREANSYDSLADAYLTSGSADKAIDTYSRGLAIDPAFSPSRIGLAWSFAALGRFDEALTAKPPLKFEEAYLVSRLGRYDEAEKLLVMGRQQAERDQILADQSVYLTMAAALALEREDYARALRELAAADTAIAADSTIRRNRQRVLIHLLSGLAELGAGRQESARRRLALVRDLYRPVVEEERFWYGTLEGEAMLASGDLERASDAFAAAQPTLRKPMRWTGAALPTILSNSLPFRDGPARAAIARGDLRAAIQAYRRLLTYDADSKFIGAFEPRYVFASAKLLEKTGDKAAALKEYERFLELWKRADPGLPELNEARRAVQRLRTADPKVGTTR